MNSKLKLKYGMVEFEIESDPETMAKERKAFLETLPLIMTLSNNKLSEVDNLESRLIDESNINYLPVQTDKTNMNINTFILEKGFYSDIDKCLGVIYFMNIVEKKEIVNNLSLKERMQKAKLVIPKSISVALHNLAVKGLIQLFENDDDKTMNYYITPEGIKYIDEYEKKDKKNKPIRKKKTVKKITANRYTSLTKEMMKLDQYPEFFKLKSSKEKIMLIMYIMKETGNGEYFTVAELEYITSQIFNDKLSTDTIKGVFKNRSTAKYFDKRNLENNSRVFEYKMLQNGFSYFVDNVINNKQ